MGVLNCSRSNCSNVMCDTYINDVGYVCSSCQEEFKNYLSDNNLNPLTEGQISRELKLFMDTPVNLYKKDPKITINEFFQKHTK